MKKKILLIVQNNSFPFDKRVYKEAQTLQNNGYSVYVISPRSTIDSQKYSDINDIKVYRYKNYLSTGSIMSFLLEYLNSVIRIYIRSFLLILKNKIRVIHVANPPDFFWPLAIVGKFFRIKFIYDQHDLVPEMFLLKSKNKFFYRLLLFNEFLTARLSTAIIVVNQSFKDRLIRKWKLKNKPCEVVYNSPKKDFYPKNNQELVKKYNDKKNILYIGLMNPTDNIDIIIESAQKIINERRRIECHFILLGDGEVRLEMEKKVKEYKLENNVEFKGIVSYDEVMEYLYIAHIGIAPDQPNGLNEYLTLIKILEYMKASKPFVGFNLTETKRLAKNAGLYAENVNDFVDKILFLLDHPEEAKNIGEVGNQSVNQQYLWEYSEKKILQLYNYILN